MLACMLACRQGPARTRVSSRAKVERPSEKAASQLGEARIGGRVVDWRGPAGVAVLLGAACSSSSAARLGAAAEEGGGALIVSCHLDDARRE